MIRFLAAAFIAACLVIAAPSAASAASISTSYCWSSLNGGGTLAPDNDMAVARDHYAWIGPKPRYSYLYSMTVVNSNTTVGRAVIYKGDVSVIQSVGCYRGSDGVYHDIPNWGGWTDQGW